MEAGDRLRGRHVQLDIDLCTQVLVQQHLELMVLLPQCLAFFYQLGPLGQQLVVPVPKQTRNSVPLFGGGPNQSLRTHKLSSPNGYSN